MLIRVTKNAYLSIAEDFWRDSEQGGEHVKEDDEYVEEPENVKKKVKKIKAAKTVRENIDPKAVVEGKKNVPSEATLEQTVPKKVKTPIKSSNKKPLMENQKSPAKNQFKKGKFDNNKKSPNVSKKIIF